MFGKGFNIHTHNQWQALAQFREKEMKSGSPNRKSSQTFPKIKTAVYIFNKY
jgi:hypothetical protein